MIKLIRDRIPEIAAARGHGLAIHTAAPAEAAELLLEKLHEEVDEVAGADEPRELLDELADVLEVVHTLGAMTGWTPDDIEAARLRKREVRGGFDRRIILTLPDA